MDFTGNELVYIGFGALGFGTVYLVLQSAFSKTDRQERQLSKTLKGKLEPEERVL